MRFVAGRGAVVESHREDVAGRGAVVAKLLRPGDATERDAAGRGTVVDLLAEAPWRRCWQGHHGGSVGQGAKEVLLAEGTVAKRMAAPWQEWQHREAPAGMEVCTKKTCQGIGVRNLGRCAMIILRLKTH